MSFWDDITGKTASDAANAAAADTYAKQQAAIAKLLSAGDSAQSQYDALAGKYDPFVSTGLSANSALARLLADPSSVRSLPGYQFQMDEGQRALDNSAAARGSLNSGKSIKDTLRFSQGLADSTYGSQLARLLAGSQFGLGATTAQNATAGSGINALLDTRKLGYGGDMTSAGTVGQGMVAGANAESAGMTNLLGMGMKLAGTALGGGFGGFGGGGSSYSSPSIGYYGSGYSSPFEGPMNAR